MDKRVSKPAMIAGVDEAGRGPLAGPVLAAAVILDANQPIEGLADSKTLSPRRREALFAMITGRSTAFGIGQASRVEIDQLNILRATELAMDRAVANLDPAPDHLLIDGRSIVLRHPSQETIVRGDQTIPSIGAASILAKVTRDRIMGEYRKIYPEYGFDRHKGYGTREHLASIRQFGACPIHRQSFSPVREHLPTWRKYVTPQERGRLGEQLAAGRLIEQGYTIVECNYNVAHIGEVDIIGLKDGVHLFCEVKSGMPGSWGPPQAQVDPGKRDRIMAAAAAYMAEKGIDSEARFSVISVAFTKAGPRLEELDLYAQ